MAVFVIKRRYTRGSVATGRACNARQVGGEKADEEATDRPSRMTEGDSAAINRYVKS